MRNGKQERFKSRYEVERSSYRLEGTTNIVHLRMLSPDGGKTHVEYFSYTIKLQDMRHIISIENDILQKMQIKMDLFLRKHKLEQMKRIFIHD